MNTLATLPVPGKLPDLSVEPVITRVADMAAAVAPSSMPSTWHKVKDTVVVVYAYGLLAFGILFPFVLAAWTAMFGPGAG
jgi:hypothetical protein